MELGKLVKSLQTEEDTHCSHCIQTNTFFPVECGSLTDSKHFCNIKKWINWSKNAMKIGDLRKKNPRNGSFEKKEMKTGLEHKFTFSSAEYTLLLGEKNRMWWVKVNWMHVRKILIDFFTSKEESEKKRVHLHIPTKCCLRMEKDRKSMCLNLGEVFRLLLCKMIMFIVALKRILLFSRVPYIKRGCVFLKDISKHQHQNFLCE